MMYDLLLQLPLFQGLSNEQLTLILEKVPFHFKKFRNNEYLVHEGDTCNEVIFILSGRIRMVTPALKSSVLIVEDFVGPFTVPFLNLFGTETASRCNIYAQGQVGAMVLDKANFLNLIGMNQVIMVHAMNMLSAVAQKQHTILDLLANSDPELRLASWLLNYTSYSAMNIVIDAEINDWCNMLSIDESALLKATRILTDEKCIEYQNGKLKLIDRYGLRTFVSRNDVQK